VHEARREFVVGADTALMELAGDAGQPPLGQAALSRCSKAWRCFPDRQKPDAHHQLRSDDGAHIFAHIALQQS